MTCACACACVCMSVLYMCISVWCKCYILHLCINVLRLWQWVNKSIIRHVREARWRAWWLLCHTCVYVLLQVSRIPRSESIYAITRSGNTEQSIWHLRRAYAGWIFFFFSRCQDKVLSPAIDRPLCTIDSRTSHNIHACKTWPLQWVHNWRRTSCPDNGDEWRYLKQKKTETN